MAEIALPMSQAVGAATLSIRVTAVRRAAVRLWLGAHLMRFAAWVSGCGVEIEVRNDVAGSMVARGGVPARWSVNDSDFDPRIGRHLRVSVDDVEIRDVVSYDIPRGFVVRYARTTNGRYRTTAETVDRPASIHKEAVRGTVTVEWIADPDPSTAQ